MLALRGTQVTDGEEEPIDDPDRREALRARGVRLAVRAGLWAGALTLGGLALPG